MSRRTLCKQSVPVFAYGAFTLSCGPFQSLQLTLPDLILRAAPRSLATTSGIVSFPQGTKMFQFPWFPCPRLFYSPRHTWACPHVGFPIRTSPAQTVAHTYPELFAVYRVLLRHLTPQAFTVRPCSFSAHLAAEKSYFSSTSCFSCLVIHLVMCAASGCRGFRLIHPCTPGVIPRRSSINPPGLSRFSDR